MCQFQVSTFQSSLPILRSKNNMRTECFIYKLAAGRNKGSIPKPNKLPLGNILWSHITCVPTEGAIP